MPSIFNLKKPIIPHDNPDILKERVIDDINPIAFPNFQNPKISFQNKDGVFYLDMGNGKTQQIKFDDKSVLPPEDIISIGLVGGFSFLGKEHLILILNKNKLGYFVKNDDGDFVSSALMLFDTEEIDSVVYTNIVNNNILCIVNKRSANIAKYDSCVVVLDLEQEKFRENDALMCIVLPDNNKKPKNIFSIVSLSDSKLLLTYIEKTIDRRFIVYPAGITIDDNVNFLSPCHDLNGTNYLWYDDCKHSVSANFHKSDKNYELRINCDDLSFHESFPLDLFLFLEKEDCVALESNDRISFYEENFNLTKNDTAFFQKDGIANSTNSIMGPLPSQAISGTGVLAMSAAFIPFGAICSALLFYGSYIRNKKHRPIVHLEEEQKDSGFVQYIKDGVANSCEYLMHGATTGYRKLRNGMFYYLPIKSEDDLGGEVLLLSEHDQSFDDSGLPEAILPTSFLTEVESESTAIETERDSEQSTKIVVESAIVLENTEIESLGEFV